MSWTVVKAILLSPTWQFTEPTEGSIFRIYHELAPVAGTFIIAQAQINQDNSVEIADARFYSSSELPEVIVLEKPEYFTSRRIGVKKISAAPGVESELRQLLRPALFNRLALQPFSPGQASQWKIMIDVSDAVLPSCASESFLNSKLAPVTTKLEKVGTDIAALLQQNTGLASQLQTLTASVANLSSSASSSSTPSSASSYSQDVLSNSPYFYLKLNELSGTVASDASTNKMDGTYTGNIVLNITDSNRSFKAVEFNGSNTKVVFTRLIAAPRIFTLECKFKTGFNGSLFSFAGGGSYDRDFHLVDGKLKLLVYNGSIIVSPLSYNDNQWHIATAVYYSGGAEMWVNGSLVASASNNNAAEYQGQWIVGQGVYGNYFKGLLAEPSVSHSRVLPEQIQKRHQKGLT